MSAEHFAIGRFRDRVEVVVTGPWTIDAAVPILSGEADRLVLNYALGFEERDLEFLRGLPVRQLVVIDRRIASLDPLGSLASSLELLHLTTDPELIIDLTRFPRLADVSADWRQVSSTVADCITLERLHVGSYSEPDLMPLASLTALRRLALTDHPRLESLRSVAAFTGLQSLGVYLPTRLAEIDELGACSELQELELEGARMLKSIDAIAGCAHLRSLNLSECGDLDSLSPLSGLTRLEIVQLLGSTKIMDGDLSPLTRLPHLRELRMQSRRHYRPTVAEIHAGLPEG